MPKKVLVDADVLRDQLDRVEGIARAHFGGYDRKTKTYPWSDEIWKARDPYGFGLYDKLRSSLNGAHEQSDKG